MKKVLSVFLAVLMVCSCMVLGASAVDSQYFGEGKAANEDQTIFLFRLQGGKCKNGQNVYDASTGNVTWKDVDDVPDTFMLVPANADEYKLGNLVTLPSVKAKKGADFVGWQRKPAPDGDTDNGVYSSAAGKYKVQAADIGRIVEFTAIYEEGEFEQDTFSKVFEILTKIFGTIIGLIAYQGNIEKGQNFMKTIFASLSD